MPKGRHVPTVASTRLAQELRRKREAIGLSQEAVAEEMGWADSKLYRIENDKSRVLVRDVKRLTTLYKVTGQEQEALLELARLAREPDWWHKYSGAIPEWFQVYVVLESTASDLFGYEAELVPGIMQTESYARAIMSTAPTLDDDEEIENKISVRVNRQARLSSDDPLNVWLVLNEAVIRRKVGGHQVMREQIDHLVALAERRNITLQVLPFDAGEHAAMHGSFQLLKFPKPGDPDKIYLEEQIGGLYTQKPDEVKRYTLMFDHLRARALGPGETIEMMHNIALQLA
ncbi:helix-turn-helix domain-containing protein [Actinomadura syzygii]|uniref:Helix-turn-helix domain-containing protein n=1 Tax=Actinomadura syzygii TaxID=1427538 RepID=A0A5D0UIL0_9ACTN|nr:helix-turn-helix transcriptional regulator [Actinomadura syzygii]TYC17443.1 helix-turn-helix domain-containing protein [Actinomadura syzygii]